MNNHKYCVMIGGIAQKGMEKYVEEYLNKLMKHSQLDDGCLIYNIHQSIKNPQEFMVYMLWDSKEAFDNHNEKPELREFRKQLAKNMFVEQSPKTYWHLI